MFDKSIEDSHDITNINSANTFNADFFKLVPQNDFLRVFSAVLTAQIMSNTKDAYTVSDDRYHNVFKQVFKSVSSE